MKRILQAAAVGAGLLVGGIAVSLVGTALAAPSAFVSIIDAISGKTATVTSANALKVDGSAAGGGAVTIADGADVTQGAVADAAWSGTGNGTVVAVLKAIWTKLGSVVATVSGSVSVSALPATPAGTNIIGGVGASKHIAGSLLTRLTGSATYTGATSANPLAICLTATPTICVPISITVSSVATVTGNVTRVTLDKSTTGATGATFRVLLYQAAPTLTSIFDATAYLAPLNADAVSAAYIGSWDCTTPSPSNASYFDCAPNAPSGNNAFNLTDGTIKAVLVATGAYVAASSETFSVAVDTLQSVP